MYKLLVLLFFQVPASLIESRVFLAQLYIFFEQAKDNTELCDTRQDVSTATSKLGVMLTRTQTTMCSMDNYLKSKNQPMDTSLLPSRTQALANCSLGLMSVFTPGDCPNVPGLRNVANYVMARDAKTGTKKLQEQFEAFYNMLRLNDV